MAAPKYRLIYNWDGAPATYSEVPQSQEAFLEQVFAPLVDTQVDALFWCTEPPRAAVWPSRVLEGAGAYDNDRLLGDVPVKLLRTLTGDGPHIAFDVVDDLSALPAGNWPRLELRLGLEQRTPVDQLAVWWDGAALENPTVRSRSAEDPLDPSDLSDPSWLVYPLAVERVAPGWHVAQVGLAKRNPQLLGDLVLSDVELHVVYEL